MSPKSLSGVFSRTSDDDAQRQAAAAKIEAIARGRAARRNNSPAPAAAPASASSTPASVTPSRRASDQPRKSNTGFFDQLGEASTRAAAAVQAHARGRLQRLEAERLAAAATRVQARYRGRSAQLAVEERRVEVQVTTTAELKHDRDENVKKVNAYGIGKQLGKGSFGTVYKGIESTKVENQGERRLRGSMGRNAASITAQVCNVTKPFYSVAQAVRAGYDVTFTKEGGGMRHRNTGKQFNYTLWNGMYELIMQLGAGFTRPGVGA